MRTVNFDVGNETCDKTCNKNEEPAVPALMPNAVEYATLSGFYLTGSMGGTKNAMQAPS